MDGYNENIKCQIEDVLLWNKIADFGEIRNINLSLGKYRWKPGSISNNDSLMKNKIIQIVYKILNDDATEGDYKFLNEINKNKKYSLSTYHRKIGKVLLQNDSMRKKAVKHILLSIINKPIQYYDYLLLIKAMIFFLKKNNE